LFAQIQKITHIRNVIYRNKYILILILSNTLSCQWFVKHIWHTFDMRIRPDPGYVFVAREEGVDARI